MFEGANCIKSENLQLNPLIADRGIKYWLKTDAVTVTLLATKSNSISFKLRLTLDHFL
jgi:hypothetical protein